MYYFGLAIWLLHTGFAVGLVLKGIVAAPVNERQISLHSVDPCIAQILSDSV